METSPPLSGTARGHASWVRFLLCCFFVIFGVRAFCVYKFGASVALVDEWEATGKEVLAAWHNGTFSWAALFQAHNGDHRIVATRLWEIFWFQVNGAWDPKIIMVLKALIYAAAGTIFTHLLTAALPRRNFAAAALFAGLYAFPFGYQNLLWGFQSQFDFFLLAAVLGWWALLRGRTVLALVVAVAAPFTLGAGAILSASFVPYAVAAWWRRDWSARRAGLFAGASLVILVGAASLRAPSAAPLGTPGEQMVALLRFTSWPYSNLLLLVARWPESAHLLPGAVVNFPSHEHSLVIVTARVMQAHPAVLVIAYALLSALMVAPLAVGAWWCWRRRPEANAVFAPLCIGVFGVLLLAASAIARSNEAVVATRFIDVVVIMGFASAAIAIGFGVTYRRARPWLIAWAALLLPGYLATMGAASIQVAHSRERLWLNAVRTYYAAHDRALLPVNDAGQLPILEKDPTAFANLLDDPTVAAILPLSVTAPERDPRPFARAVLIVAKFGWAITLFAALGAWLVAMRANGVRRFSTGPGAAPAAVRV